MIIDSRGISVAGTTSPLLYGGTLTSSDSFLTFYFLGSPQVPGSYLSIDSVITDSYHQVGVKIINQGSGAIFLEGDQSNTFTGNVEISGTYSGLVLNKSNGATAVRSNVFVRNNALFRFANNDQLLKTSNVTLATSGRLQVLAHFGGNITNTFKNLIVEGNGIIHFNHKEGNSTHSKYYIYIDDLIINEGGHLEIHDWHDGQDFLLVRKNSQCLADALKKMSFVGYDPNNIHLEDFDTEYWSISATPEPTIYGAILGAAGIGLWCWHKRRRGTYRIH